MKRIWIPERPDWRDKAKAFGFGFHSMYGAPYWDETRAYVFSLAEIENQLEAPTAEIYDLCLYAVDFVLNREQWLNKMHIPEAYRDWLSASWDRRDPSLYGRFDFAYGGHGPAKLLEFNADTPTGLYESGFFQWPWMHDQVAAGVLPPCDQFNSIQDKLIARFMAMFEPGIRVHFSCCKDTDEDRATVKYLEDCAVQAGLDPHFVFIDDIGLSDDHYFVDTDKVVIEHLFKLYPYEDMFQEDFGPALTYDKVSFIEPQWKVILSNKAILPVLWHLAPGHPNLLPAFFEDDPASQSLSDYVRKPFFSREGENIEVVRDGILHTFSDGAYGDGPFIRQAFTEIPKFGEDYAVIGSWVIGDEPAGIGIREDRGLITQNLSRFIPHIIAPDALAAIDVTQAAI